MRKLSWESERGKGGLDEVGLGYGVRSHFLEAWELKNKKLFPMTGNELIFFESAQNAAGGFFGEPCHIGQVLVGKPNGNADAVAFLNSGSLR